MVTIKTKLIPAGTNARSGYALNPRFLTIHNTANTKNGADAESHAHYLQGGGKNISTSYHYVVDDKEIYKLLPDNEVAWHAGDGANGPGNRQSLALEICENADGDLLKATNNAVDLVAYLMKLHNIPLSNVVQHNRWSGKNCPNRIRKGEPYDWQTFLNKVQAAYSGTAVKPVDTVSALSATPCRIYIGAASSGDIATLKALINGLGIATVVSGGYITTGYTSKGDQITILSKCKELSIGYRIYDGSKQEAPGSGLQATDLVSMTNDQIVAKVGPLFTKDQEKTGVLACVSLAQFILESSYGKSELAQNANNCFGMKKSLSGNTWSGSKWDGVSVYVKGTAEHTGTQYININAPFRKYACIEDSIEDHSAYLIGARKGVDFRYAGLKGETDYKKAVQIIKDGGYATSPTYVPNLCNLIERLDLTKYNAKSSTSTPTVTTPSVSTSEVKKFYRVRKSWADAASQVGAYTVLENAKENCKPGYYVFDWNGNIVYPVSAQPAELSIGDEVNLVSGATYINGKSIPNWVINSKLYVREIRTDGSIVFSTVKSGAITGVADKKYFVKDASFSPYTVKVVVSALNIRSGPGTNYDIVGCIKDGGIYTIIQQDGNWGFLKSKVGWISLDYTQRT